MTKYFIEGKDEDFIIDVPADAQVLMGGDGYSSESKTMRIVQREKVTSGDGEFAHTTYNDHVLAVYHDVQACRSEEVKRLDPEVA